MDREVTPESTPANSDAEAITQLAEQLLTNGLAEILQDSQLAKTLAYNLQQYSGIPLVFCKLFVNGLVRLLAKGADKLTSAAAQKIMEFILKISYLDKLLTYFDHYLNGTLSQQQAQQTFIPVTLQTAGL